MISHVFNFFLWLLFLTLFDRQKLCMLKLLSFCVSIRVRLHRCAHPRHFLLMSKKSIAQNLIILYYTLPIFNHDLFTDVFTGAEKNAKSLPRSLICATLRLNRYLRYNCFCLTHPLVLISQYKLYSFCSNQRE